METKKLTISIELAQALLNYLQTRPYVEVHQFIQALLNAEPLPEKITDEG